MIRDNLTLKQEIIKMTDSEKQSHLDLAFEYHNKTDNRFYYEHILSHRKRIFKN